MNRIHFSTPARIGPVAGATTRFVLAVLVSIATIGCQTLKSRSDKDAAPSSVAQGAKDPSAPKSDFHAEVSSEQEFNVHLELARVHESQGNNEAAVAEYQKAVDVGALKGSVIQGAKLGPAQQALAQRRMAAALDRMGRFAQAETHYQKAIKLTPADAKVWNDAGYSYYLQNRWPDAERALKTADSIEPNNSRALTNLGLTLAAQGKNDEALAVLSRAGGPAIGHANLGYLLAAMGKTEDARRHYNEAITLQPELNAARLAIAKLDSQAAAPLAPGSIVVTSPPVVVPAATQARTPPTPPPTLPPLPPNLTTAIKRPVVKPATGDAQIKRTSTSKPKRALIKRTPKPPALDAAKVE
jgi:Flp pilus assembly protein TadD